MKISVVIPTHNRSDALAETLDRLSKQRFDADWEVIVVNNRSTDDTDDVVGRLNFPVSLRLLHEEKAGAAAARNAGARVSTAEFLIFLDNDILVESDFVLRHYQALKRNPGCWILGKILGMPEHEQTPFGKFRATHYAHGLGEADGIEVKGLTGANSSMPLADWNRFCGFDETFTIASVEDLDLAIRATQAGVRILYYPTIVGLHNDWAGLSIRDFCYRQCLYSRSELLLWRKHKEGHPRMEFVRENLPPDSRKDSFQLLVRKTVKKTLGSGLVESTLYGLCNAMERWWPYQPALWRLYRLLLSAAIYKGFQEGLAENKMSGEIEQNLEPQATVGRYRER